ncbi:MAG: hypothetical protein ACYC35_26375 [Pirellulales bacterium]
MSDNPYQSPRADVGVSGIRSGRREDLRSIASYQKGILVCILVYLVTVIGQFVLPEGIWLFVALGVFAVGIAGTVFVFLLAMKVYSTGVGILLGILSFIPCVGLLVLLAVNGKATTILRANGIRVGLLGARLSDI